MAQLKGVLGRGGLRALLLVVFLLNLSFAGLLTNFPLFSNVRFGWDATANAFFFAFVGVCAVLTQGVLIGRLQPRFGEVRLVLGGLSLMAVNLGLMAGYLTLLAALYLPIPALARYRSLTRWALVEYTALTIFLWILFGARTPIGYTDKAIEAALIALLLLANRWRSQPSVLSYTGSTQYTSRSKLGNYRARSAIA